MPGSSDVDLQLKARNIDTILITGTATNVCCESTARDAMLLDYKVIMLSDGGKVAVIAAIAKAARGGLERGHSSPTLRSALTSTRRPEQ
jgi:nicotinamidase-related amidase